MHANFKLGLGNAERVSGWSDDYRTQKVSYYVHIQKMRAKKKVVLAVELSIYSQLLLYL